MFRLVLALSFVLASQATLAKNKHKKENENLPAVTAPVTNALDLNLIEVNNQQKRVRFVEAKNLKVIQLLADDTHGLEHQKFVVQMSNSRKITVVYNLDMCEKVPVQVGDTVSVGGEYIPTGKASGIVHWTHFDPKKNRQDGYVAIGDRFFCHSD